MKYYIHKEGKKSIIFFGIVFLLISVAALLLIPIICLSVIITTILVILWLFVISFFRIPRRVQPTFKENDVVAPADGKIVTINTVFEKEFFNDERLLISIFMSPANVHVNRFPIDGIVKYVKYHAGKYLVAFHEKSSELNERNTVVVSNQKHDILVRQIAGAIARRIACYTKPEMRAARCGELGFIRFGSRVDVYLPLTSSPIVAIGQKVKGGIDIIAEL